MMWKKRAAAAYNFVYVIFFCFFSFFFFISEDSAQRGLQPSDATQPESQNIVNVNTAGTQHSYYKQGCAMRRYGFAVLGHIGRRKALEIFLRCSEISRQYVHGGGNAVQNIKNFHFW